MKIKITEYFPGHDVMGSDLGVLDGLGIPSPVLQESAVREQQQAQNQQFGLLTPSLNPPLPEGHPGVNGQRFFTIQRVNGNGGNGKNDGITGGHRHTLEESDRVKKNSVQRWLMKNERERKKAQVRLFLVLELPVSALVVASPSFSRFVESYEIRYSSNALLHKASSAGSIGGHFVMIAKAVPFVSFVDS